MQFLGNFGKIVCWSLLLGEILDPPLLFDFSQKSIYTDHSNCHGFKNCHPHIIKRYSFYEIIYFIQLLSNTFNQLSCLWLLLKFPLTDICNIHLFTNSCLIPKLAMLNIGVHYEALCRISVVIRSCQSFVPFEFKP